MSAATESAPKRILAIDAFRGFVMFLMMAEVLEFGHVAEANPSNRFWAFLAWNQSHVEWFGCSLHDLIQPSFSFLVGVSLPFSIASRLAKGESRSSMWRHAAIRAVALVLLGVFLRSIGKPQTYWTFEDTLSQIGLGYLFLFWLGLSGARWQWIAFGGIVGGYWLANVLYPLPSVGFDYASVGVPADWAYHSQGLAAHFNKNSNLAWAFDTWFLNLFPREEPFTHNGGGYATLSFIPTLGTMLLGLIAGRVLRGGEDLRPGLVWLGRTALLLIVLGAFAHYAGLCPIVKRIWSPSWIFFSGGLCLLLLGAFLWWGSLRRGRLALFPLAVIGMNSIFIYTLVHVIGDAIPEALRVHLGRGIFGELGEAYEPLLSGGAHLAVCWVLLWWMYRRRLFLRL